MQRTSIYYQCLKKSEMMSNDFSAYSAFSLNTISAQELLWSPESTPLLYHIHLSLQDGMFSLL